MEKKYKKNLLKKIIITLVVISVSTLIIFLSVFFSFNNNGKIYPDVYSDDILESKNNIASLNKQIYSGQSGFYIEEDVNLNEIASASLKIEQEYNNIKNKYPDYPITAFKFNLILDLYDELNNESIDRLYNQLKSFENIILSKNLNNWKKGIIIQFKYNQAKSYKILEQHFIAIVAFAQKESNLYKKEKTYNKNLVCIKGPEINNKDKKLKNQEYKHLLKIYIEGLSFNNNLILSDNDIKILNNSLLPNIGREFILDGKENKIEKKEYKKVSNNLNVAIIEIDKNEIRDYNVFNVLRNIINCSISLINLTKSKDTLDIIEKNIYSKKTYNKEGVCLYDNFYKEIGEKPKVSEVLKAILGSHLVVNNYRCEINKNENTANISFNMLNFGSAPNLNVKEVIFNYKIIEKDKTVNKEILMIPSGEIKNYEDLKTYKTIKYTIKNINNINKDSFSESKIVIQLYNGNEIIFKV